MPDGWTKQQAAACTLCNLYRAQQSSYSERCGFRVMMSMPDERADQTTSCRAQPSRTKDKLARAHKCEYKKRAIGLIVIIQVMFTFESIRFRPAVVV